MTAEIARADTAEAETAEAGTAEADIATVAPTIVEAGNPLGTEQVDTAMPPMRPDLQLIADMIPPRCRVLDIGCDRGDLLAALWRAKAVDGRGLELSMAGVRACVRRGLSVVQGDADTDLVTYPDAAFDYAVLSQTLQAMRDPKEVLCQLVRIGRRAIVSFPNFGHWRVRWALMSSGRMPVTRHLHYNWYDTPNIHFCTIRDLDTLCADLGIVVERRIVLFGNGVARDMPLGWRANWMGRDAIFLLRHGRGSGA